MTKKTDEKGTKDDKDLDKEAAAAKEDEEESEEDASDEEDEEESDEDEDDEEDEDEDDEPEEAVTAKPAKDERRQHRPVAHADDDDDDEDEVVEEDPTWWAPHAVLGTLVLIGVLGFFGVFNKALGFLAAPMSAPTDTTTTTTPTTKAADQAKPQQPQQGQAQQPQQPREMFGAKHLLVMYKGGRRAPPTITRTKEEAKARAEEALKKAKSGKVKFEDLVTEYSDEPGAGTRGGDLGKFPKGAMVPEFQSALEKMKVNDVSDLVETPFGYHVILRTQ
jgi:hypothetical protein